MQYIFPVFFDKLDEQLLNFQFHSINGRFQLRCFIGGDGTGDDRSGDTTSASQGNFTAKVKLGNARERQKQWRINNKVS
jgi:hypothetical protein